MLGKEHCSAQAGETVPRRAGLGGTPGRVGAELCQEGVVSESRLSPRMHAHACCCCGSEPCAGVSSMSPAASLPVRCPGARRRAEPGKAGGTELRQDRAP